jgi:hypothetical protein
MHVMVVVVVVLQKLLCRTAAADWILHCLPLLLPPTDLSSRHAPACVSIQCPHMPPCSCQHPCSG